MHPVRSIVHARGNGWSCKGTILSGVIVSSGIECQKVDLALFPMPQLVPTHMLEAIADPRTPLEPEEMADNIVPFRPRTPINATGLVC